MNPVSSVIAMVTISLRYKYGASPQDAPAMACLKDRGSSKTMYSR